MNLSRSLLVVVLSAAALARAADAPPKSAPCCVEKPAAPAPCCAEKPVVKTPPCCAEVKSAPFSRDSLYQLDATFVDDAGRPVSLGDLRGRPVILTLFFSSCGYACPLLLGDMMRIRAGLTPEVRERARLVLVSFDVRRDTPEKLAAFRQQRQLDAGYLLLHAEAAGVSELAALLGVKYKEEADGSFAHSNVITVLNPAGEIVHQRLGLRDGLAEAAAAVMLASQTEATP
ncbi:MAG TPA: SCO family protein [Opitutaceae bacterium]|jgi:protein SCO1/2|nr:SCO family protein [Opitutaceae bacterium]HRE08953.1 SCO family protein [Opitutaceae bacterium]